jgi:hypothetical protein
MFPISKTARIAPRYMNISTQVLGASFSFLFTLFLHVQIGFSQTSINAGPISKTSSPAGLKPGEVVIVTLQGTATAIESTTGKIKKLSIGDRLLQGWTIQTKGNSKVGLGFANGTFIEVAPDSQFVIQEFFIEPWDVASTDFEKIDTEPSKSKSTLALQVGQILVDIKKLKSGSGMDIATPLATAGIRGTTGQITHLINSDGTPRSTSVNVPDGSMVVASVGGGESVTAAGQSTAIISMAPSPDGQASNIQTSTGRSDPSTSAAILAGASSLQITGMQAFVQGMAASLQNPLTYGANLSPDQRQRLQEANESGAETVVETVSMLSSESPESAPEIAQFATSLSPELAPRIAAAAASSAPQNAVFISVAVAVVAPYIAPQIAASVAIVSPSAAPQIAGATAAVIPTQASEIAGQVAVSVPDSAVPIAQSVAKSQPQRAQQIAQSIISQVPQGDSSSILNAVEIGAQQGAGNTQQSGPRPQPGAGGTSGQPVQPISRP